MKHPERDRKVRSTSLQLQQSPFRLICSAKGSCHNITAIKDLKYESIYWSLCSGDLGHGYARLRRQLAGNDKPMKLRNDIQVLHRHAYFLSTPEFERPQSMSLSLTTSSSLEMQTAFIQPSMIYQRHGPLLAYAVVHIVWFTHHVSFNANMLCLFTSHDDERLIWGRP